MRVLLVVFIVASPLIVNAQSSNIRDEWRVSKKIKLDLLSTIGEYPSFTLGFEYPLKDNYTSIEHEIGPIFNSGIAGSGIERSSGFKTSHTYLLHSKRNDYVIGVGLHFRQLNVQGQITACATGSNGMLGGCSFFRLVDEPIRTQRWAVYTRLRRKVYVRDRVTFSGGFDLGALNQSIRNPEFKRDNLTLRNALFRQNLNNRKSAYFRAHFQLLYRL